MSVVAIERASRLGVRALLVWGVLGAALESLICWRFWGEADLVPYCYIGALAVVLSAYDIAAYRLPNRIVLPSYPIVFALLAFAAGTDDEWSALLRAGLAMVFCLAGYLALALAFPGQLGMGDVKLAGLVGAACGFFSWQVLFAGVLIGFVLAAVVTAPLVTLGRIERRTRVPFAPFVLGGALLALIMR
jgi:leader peptidase (prepilin peptidase)/N-methyltransferase